ncbi:MAG TPA: ergothioneine biosynthesis protein EgtB [Polyangiales bacterium]|nr:ergothioneine biosynthesis protein EgtB [Polyangiales bacterium]
MSSASQALNDPAQGPANSAANSARSHGPQHDPRARLIALFRELRAATERLCAPLSAEDQQLQSMPAASPTKWHRAHTTWFFEKALLEPAGLPPVDELYGFLFNSYYESFGPRHLRAERGLLSRPSAEEVTRYRHEVDARVCQWLERADHDELQRVTPLIELGVAHEEQHQELILTDILHAFSRNPLEPAYCAPDPSPARESGELPAPLPASLQASPAGTAVSADASSSAATRFLEHPGGLYEIGAELGCGFCFDCELPRHKLWLEPFELAEGLVTIAELKAFMRDGGYRTPSLWLSEGYDFVCAQGISAPLYMSERDGVLRAFSLRGPRVPSDDEPVSHLSYYEADALARYLGARLPSEAEWELGARDVAVLGSFVECGHMHPARSSAAPGMQQVYGEVWQWTRSSYEPYPGYQPLPGAIGEYNGKFMVNQRVLRGGSCLTPARHLRASYRNFWYPDTRFQMTGLRLARDVRMSSP